jgi:segregation and condensation protein A
VEPYKIRTEVFEGPLDVLLTLIEKRKLLINDIALSEVANDYINYLEQHREFPIAETAQFVLVGSTLLLIKSKSLLPVLELTSEEQLSIHELETRLKVLERYKQVAKVVQARFGTTPALSRTPRKNQHVVFSPLKNMTLVELHKAIRSVLDHLPSLAPKLAEATVKKVMSLEQMMERLTTRINEGLQVSFRQFALSSEGKVNTIISFLAMLELVRQGMIRVEQETKHGDIVMHSDQAGVPRYT